MARTAKRQTKKNATQPRREAAAVPVTPSPFKAFFTRFAIAIAQSAGRPATFLLAVLLVGAWAATGPLFGYSDTWQLVINTSTTIITFLMVFLIQNTQNRDTLALQVKLAELIHAVSGAKDRLATAEDLSDEELEQLHAEYRELASAALGHLERRRATDA
jgi:low affinity Fe/Cu permease